MSGGLSVTTPVRERHGRTEDIHADVGTQDLWFSSSDSSLCPSLDAFVTLLLLPASHLGVPLELPGTISPRLLEGTKRVAGIARTWWGVDPRPIRLPAPSNGDLSHAPVPTGTGAAPGELTALCFTGGVDSFFTLLRGSRPVDVLIFVHGYDIPLADTWRMEAFEPGFRAVAASVGARGVIVRTNLWSHPIFPAAPWVRSHGGALAALGHLMVNHVGRLLISSSYPYAYDAPWGSHWKLDHLWSSERLEVEHAGATHWRSEKLELIADEPLVQRHLRVCWENRSPDSLNCSECEKCVRTQLTLAACGRLADFTVFTTTTSLLERVEALPALKNAEFVAIYNRLLDGRLDPMLHAAVQRLVDRSVVR